MFKIYHNPRCRKSREGLAILEASGSEFETVHYLKDPLNKEELKKLVRQLDLEPMDLVRKGEAIWKSDYKGKDLSDDAILKALATHPILMERPVVSDGQKAVIGRPPEDIKNLLS